MQGEKKKKKSFKVGAFCHLFSKTVVKFPSLVFPIWLKTKISMITDSNNENKFWMCPEVVITLGNIVTKTDAYSSEVQYINPYFFE